MRILLHLALFVIFASTGVAQEYMNKIDASVLKQFAQKEKHVSVIVRFHNEAYRAYEKPQGTKLEKAMHVYRQSVEASKNQSKVQALLASERKAFATYSIVNSIAVEVDKVLLMKIAQDPDVVEVIYDAPYMREIPADIQASTSLRSVEPEWGIQMIGADSVWTMGYRGEGVTIGGQDTGYEWDVAPLRNKYRGWSIDTVDHNYNWHDAIHALDSLHGGGENPCGLNSLVPCDDNNHGTHTMGTMVGEDVENKIGVAPGANWIGCRNMERGYGRISTYLECFEWFLAPYDLEGNNPNPALAPHVINNSWGCVTMEGCNINNFHILHDAVRKLKESGIVVVVSAGNSGSSCGSVSTPAALYEESFSVGATTSIDSIAGFSSRGTVEVDSSYRLKPNISAPGSGIRSVIRGGNFASYSGTSMAGPHVAGVVALMISANPSLAGQVHKIEDILESTAVAKYSDQNCGNYPGSEIPNATFGYGRIDAVAAVQAALGNPVSTVETSKNPSALQVYPVPSENHITIQAGESFSRISLYAMDGRKILDRNITKTQQYLLDIMSMRRGVYTLCAYGDSGMLCQKFVR